MMALADDDPVLLGYRCVFMSECTQREAYLQSSGISSFSSDAQTYGGDDGGLLSGTQEGLQ